jgi:tetratricopeptide (TPR) repeat protein
MNLPSVGGYIDLIRLILGESVRYFAVLLFAVLAIRLWRGGRQLTGNSRWHSLFVAALFALLAAGIGYFSIRSSMAKLYSYYARQAFEAGRLDAACLLFDTSTKFRTDADAIGREGVCLLLLGNPATGEALLERARQVRGDAAAFENYYHGLYYILNGEPKRGVPFFEAVSADVTYHWIVLKYFAALALDVNDPTNAAELMKPYMEADITDADQAYIIASLKFLAGQKTEAQQLVDKFYTPDLPSFWKTRFEKLQTKLKADTR